MNSTLTKILNLVKTHQSDIVLALCVIMLTAISFNLGRVSASKSAKTPVTIEGGQMANTASIYQPSSSASKAVKANYHTDQTVVASSKSKTKYYHFSWCSGAKQISDKNKLTFNNEAAAIAAGFTLASNCER